jgi:heat shock protein HslJ/uncharacterized protein YraI
LMKTLIKLCILILGLMIMAGCQGNGVSAAPEPTATPAPSSGLSGTSWNLTTLNGDLPIQGSAITLNFGADGIASGTDGCNQYSMGFAQDGNSLTFAQPGASTMMACQADIMQQASAYMLALATTTTFSANARQLTLQDGGQILATFAASSQNLSGTSWHVTSYNNGQEAVVSLIVGTDITLNFGDDGSVSGNSGCNDFAAGYSASNGEISINMPASTMRFCADPPGVMEQETEFLAALTSAATYSVQGNQLQMRTADDQLALFATRQIVIDLPEPPVEPATPTGRATAPRGLNVRSGPGTNFPVLGVANYGDEGEIVGRSADGQWWAVAIPAAPNGVGWVSADFVVATNVENVPVLESPAPPVVVPTVVPVATPTPVPAATATPVAQITFTADQTTIDQGQCTTIRWSAQNVEAVWINPSNNMFDQTPRPTNGSMQVCPASTTTYVMRVMQRDGSIVSREVTITVRPAATPEAQISFWADSTNINQGQCTRLNWHVENVQGVWVYPQGQNFNNFPRVGIDSEQVCPNSTTTYEMRVLQRDGSVVFRTVTINVNQTATATPVPPTATPLPSNPLAGTNWNVTQYNDGNAIHVLIADTFASADFGSNGQVNGNGGCNRFSGGYTVSGSSLSMPLLSIGMSMCADPDGIMEQEAAIILALQSAATFRIEGNTLNIFNGAGQTAVILSRAN